MARRFGSNATTARGLRPEIPYTLTGKKMEVPVRKILMGASPDAVLNRNAMSNPQILDVFVAYAKNQRDYQVRT